MEHELYVDPPQGIRKNDRTFFAERIKFHVLLTRWVYSCTKQQKQRHSSFEPIS